MFVKSHLIWFNSHNFKLISLTLSHLLRNSLAQEIYLELAIFLANFSYLEPKFRIEQICCFSNRFAIFKLFSLLCEEQIDLYFFRHFKSFFFRLFLWEQLNISGIKCRPFWAFLTFLTVK